MSHWHPHKGFHWATGESRMHVNKALSIREREKVRTGQLTSRDGDVWCCEDCYLKGKGIRRFPKDYESGNSSRTNHFANAQKNRHPKQGILPSNNVCRIVDRALSRGESLTSSKRYEIFLDDLKNHFDSNEPSSYYRDKSPSEFFSIDEGGLDFHKDGGELDPDITITHVEGDFSRSIRVKTEVVVIDKNYERRAHFYRERASRQQVAQPDRVIIDVGRWTQEMIRDFNRHGVKKLRDEWRRSNTVMEEKISTAKAEKAQANAEKAQERRQRLIDIEKYPGEGSLKDIGVTEPASRLSDELLDQIFSDEEKVSAIDAMEKRIREKREALYLEQIEKSRREAAAIQEKYRATGVKIRQEKEKGAEMRVLRADERRPLHLRIKELQKEGAWDLISDHKARSLGKGSIYVGRGPPREENRPIIQFHTDMGFPIGGITSLFSFLSRGTDYNLWKNGWAESDLDMEQTIENAESEFQVIMSAWKDENASS
ncbi:MAG: hypothetical protein QGG21_02445 [Candidatus Thalassarchaeaceae archaeon]|jgi:hypothetical protein|nr:hypothetical protein [Candidatus Thalassarchaeaceae archaeon]